LKLNEWCSVFIQGCTAVHSNIKPTTGKEAQATWGNIKVLYIQRMNEKGQENCTFHFP
jgi:hypothetical protein